MLLPNQADEAIHIWLLTPSPLTGMGDWSYLDAGWQPWEHSLVNPTTSSPQFLYIRRAGGRVGSGLRDYWEQGSRGDLPLLVARFHATSGDSK